MNAIIAYIRTGMAKAAGRCFAVLVYACALFGFLDLVGRGIVFPFTGMLFGYAIELPHDFDVQQTLASDDGAYKALIFIWSGPAFNAGCEKMVAVVDAWAPVQTSWTSDHLVYEAGCDLFFAMHWEPPADGRAKPRLRIEAEAAKGDFMSLYAMKGRVAVAYRADP